MYDSISDLGSSGNGLDIKGTIIPSKKIVLSIVWLYWCSLDDIWFIIIDRVKRLVIEGNNTDSNNGFK